MEANNIHSQSKNKHRGTNINRVLGFFFKSKLPSFSINTPLLFSSYCFQFFYLYDIFSSSLFCTFTYTVIIHRDLPPPILLFFTALYPKHRHVIYVKNISESYSNFPKVTKLVVCSFRTTVQQFRSVQIVFFLILISIYPTTTSEAQLLHVSWAITLFTKAAFSSLLNFVSVTYSFEVPEIYVLLLLFFPSVAQAFDYSNPPSQGHLVTICTI